MAHPLLLPTPADTTVVIVDFQERLWPAMNTILKPGVMKHAQALLKGAAVHSVPVLFTEQYPKGLGPTLTDIRHLIGDGEPIVKTAFSCCDVDEFTTKLGALGRSNVAVLGMETHVCVFQTVVGLIQRGYQPWVVKDAVCSRKRLDHDTAIELMGKDGASLTTTENLLFAWTRQAGTDAFKKISAIVRDLA